MVQSIARSVFFFLSLGLVTPVWAVGGVAVLLSSPGGVYVEVAETLQAELAKSSAHKVTVFVLGQSSVDEVLAQSPQLLVTVGNRAAQAAFRMQDARFQVLSVLLPKATFDALLTTQRAHDPKRFSAIFIDQPFGRQLDLVRLALGGGLRVGVVLGPESASAMEQMLAAAEARGLSLVAERVDRGTELYPALQRLMSVTDALIVVPDAQVVNVETAQNLLLTSFRFHLPVIGYSAGYIKAGALMGVYSTPGQIGSEAGEWVRAYLKGSGVPLSRYPRNFSVGTNDHIARSLGLRLLSEAVLKERLQRFSE